MNQLGKPIYIVSGVYRSGTSMMMNAIEQGGIPGVYDRIDNMKTQVSNMIMPFHPNPNGFFEDNHAHLFNHSIFAYEYQGKVAKIFYNKILSLPKGNYKVVFLLRNPKEIKKSLENFKGYLVNEQPVIDFYDMVIPALLKKLKTREDIELTVLNYKDIIANPVKELSKLNWSIDINKAASVIDPALHRVKV